MGQTLMVAVLPRVAWAILSSLFSSCWRCCRATCGRGALRARVSSCWGSRRASCRRGALRARAPARARLRESRGC
jgi:hypothetical protein